MDDFEDYRDNHLWITTGSLVITGNLNFHIEDQMIPTAAQRFIDFYESKGFKQNVSTATHIWIMKIKM